MINVTTTSEGYYIPISLAPFTLLTLHFKLSQVYTLLAIVKQLRSLTVFMR